jgi:hypothetical protein
MKLSWLLMVSVVLIIKKIIFIPVLDKNSARIQEMKGFGLI